VAITSLLCLVVHIGVNLGQDCGDLLTEFYLTYLVLFSVMADSNLHFVLLQIFGSDFKSNWSALYLPVVKLKAWVVVLPIVDLNSNTSSFKLFSKFPSSVYNLLTVVILKENWDDNDLNLGYSWGEDNSCVIRVDHDHRADGAC
jgi:hypothetical protein